MGSTRARARDCPNRWGLFRRETDPFCSGIDILEDYDIALAERLVQGIDVWVNTPRRGREACGTSGMKILVNGGLNLSSRDGWWDEAFGPDVGWTFGGFEANDPVDAEDLYRVIETEVVPEFYDRDAMGLPRRWIERMRVSMSRLGGQYCSNRMLADYLVGHYIPAARQYRNRLEEGGSVARALSDWQRLLETHWTRMHFVRSDATRTDSGWRFTVLVQLGEIQPDEIAVELIADETGEWPPMRVAFERGPVTVGTLHGYEYHCDVATDRPEDHFTTRILPAHPHAQLPAELPLILWQR